MKLIEVQLLLNLEEVDRGSIVAQLGSTESPLPLLKFQLRKDGKPIESDKINFIF